MVKKVTVSLIDDLDGESAADETVEFAIDGVNYEVDLSSKNAQELRSDLQKWIGAARRVGGRRKARFGSAIRTSAGGDETPAIREWARGSGYQLADRGRIPLNILDAYRAAH
jgi:Lsr2